MMQLNQQSIMCGVCSNKSIKLIKPSWEIRCTKCGRKGHWANDCSKK